MNSSIARFVVATLSSICAVGALAAPELEEEELALSYGDRPPSASPPAAGRRCVALLPWQR